MGKKKICHFCNCDNDFPFWADEDLLSIEMEKITIKGRLFRDNPEIDAEIEASIYLNMRMQIEKNVLKLNFWCSDNRGFSEHSHFEKDLGIIYCPMCGRKLN